MHKHLTAVERTEVAGLRIAETDDAEKFVGGGIGHRHGVRELFRRIDPVVAAQRDIRCGSGKRSLPGKGRRNAGEYGARKQAGQEMAFHGRDSYLVSAWGIAPGTGGGDASRGSGRV